MACRPFPALCPRCCRTTCSSSSDPGRGQKYRISFADLQVQLGAGTSGGNIDLTRTESFSVSEGYSLDTSPVPPQDDPVTHGREIDATNTGPHATPSGTTYNTPQTISTAGTYSNLIFNKGLTITADNVELYDCLITTDVTSSSFCLKVTGNNVSVHHCEIDNQELVYYAIENNGGAVGGRNRFWRNNIHHAGQGISSAYSYWDFYENYVHDIVAPEPFGPGTAPHPGDSTWHADGVISWGEHITVERNKILVQLQQTGVINIGTWVGMPAHNVTDVTIDSNYFAGAGFIFYVEERGVQDVLDFTITNNDIGQDYYTNGGYYGVWYQGAPPAVNPTVTGNRIVTYPGGTFVSNVDYYL